MKIQIEDIYGTEVELGFSNSGYYRLDLKNDKDFPPTDDGLCNNMGKCLSFNEDQIRILYHALTIMIKGQERY